MMNAGLSTHTSAGATCASEELFAPIVRTIANITEAAAARNGDRCFLAFEDREFSYSDFERQTNMLANGLARIGIEQGMHVAVMLSNKPEALFTYFALGKLGAVGVAINTSMKGELLRYFLENSDAAMVIADTQFMERLAPVLAELAAVRGVVVCEEESPLGDSPNSKSLPLHRFDELMAASDAAQKVALTGLDLFLILYTSGTTGPSKGVLSTHAHAITVGYEMVRSFGFDENDTLFVCLPLYHANALLNSCMAALLANAKIALARRFSVSRFWDDVRTHHATQISLLGAMVNFLWSAPSASNDSDNDVRICQIVPVPTHCYDGFERRFGLKFVSLYGITDVSLVTARPSDAPSHQRLSAGLPCRHVEVRIFDQETDVEQPQGTKGEIVVREREAHVLSPGYHKNPEAGVAARRGGWFHTGDRGYLDAEGYLHFVDRIKDSIRRRGENISSYEVEQALEKHPAIQEVAAFAVQSEHGEDEIMVSVILVPRHDLEAPQLIDHCQRNMPYFMVPRYVEFVTALPRTATQKVEKYKLRAEAERRLPTLWDREKAGIVLSR